MVNFTFTFTFTFTFIAISSQQFTSKFFPIYNLLITFSLEAVHCTHTDSFPQTPTCRKLICLIISHLICLKQHAENSPRLHHEIISRLYLTENNNKQRTCLSIFRKFCIFILDYVAYIHIYIYIVSLKTYVNLYYVHI